MNQKWSTYFSIIHALGLRILKDSVHRKEALRTIKEQRMFFAGPREIKQGGLSLIGRWPIEVNNEFWGFSTVIISLENLLVQSGINEFSHEQYNFQFSKIDPNTGKETFYLPDFDNFDKSYSEEVILPDGDWKFYIAPTNPHEIAGSLFPVALFILFLSGFFAFGTYYFSMQPLKLRVLVAKKSNELAKVENQFQTVFNQAAIGMALVDTKTGNLLESNSRLQQQLGYKNTELKKLDFQEISSKEDYEENERLLKELRNNKRREYSQKLRLKKKNGEFAWIRLTVSALWQPGELPDKHIALVEDISESERAKKDLLRSEIKFRSIFNEAAVGMVRADSNTGEILETNKSFQKMLGYSSQELREKKFREISHPDELRQNLELLEKLTKNEIRKFTVQKRFIKKDGAIVWVQLSITPLWGKAEKPTFHIAIAEDITEKVEAQKKLVQSEKRFRAIVEYSNEMILVLDKNRQPSYYSPALKKIIEQANIDFERNPLISIVHPEDHLVIKNKVEEAEKQPGVPQKEIVFRSLANKHKVLWKAVTITSLLHEESIKGLVFNIHDITASKEAQIKLKKSFDLVTEQNKRLINFSYIVSHNLRSHSSNLESLLDLYKEAENQDEKEEYLQLLPTVSSALSQTLMDLNDVVTIHNNHALKIELLSVKDYLEKTLESLKVNIQDKNAEISTHIPEEMKVYFNPAYLESIFLNLISNALKYSAESRQPTISIKGYLKDGKWILEIMDNGIGIDLEKHGTKIFGLYNTFSNASNSRGIGLFITQNQMEAMAGRITVESEPGKGATFKLFFE